MVMSGLLGAEPLTSDQTPSPGWQLYTQSGNPPPGPQGFADPWLIRPEAVVTLLYTASLIPA